MLGAALRTLLAVCACGYGAGCAGLAPPPRNVHAWHELLPGLSKDTPPPAGMLRAGDRIVIAVGDGKTAPREHTTWIEGDGRAHVAAGQDVEVAGVDIKSAEGRITAALRQRDKFAVVDIRLAPEALRSAVVLGAVANPGRVELVPAMRVADLIANAGGLTLGSSEGGQLAQSPADLTSARVLRDGRALPVDLTRALAGELGHNVYVHRGDIVYVPFVESNGVAVLGQVQGAGIVPYRTGLRLTEALAVSQGLSSWGDGDDVRIIRGPAQSPTAYRASLDDFVDGEARDVRLLPGDIVFVQDEPLEDVYEVIMVVSPILGILSTFLLTTIAFSAP